ncbi:ARID domain-containing protein [Balamuthia mandrillaris]
MGKQNNSTPSPPSSSRATAEETLHRTHMQQSRSATTLPHSKHSAKRMALNDLKEGTAKEAKETLNSKLLRWASVGGIVLGWLLFTSTVQKVEYFLMAFLFAGIEYTFRALTTMSEEEKRALMKKKEEEEEKEEETEETGEKAERPRAKLRRSSSRLSLRHITEKGDTTWEQFWMNVFWNPIGTHLYRAMFSSVVVRLLLFPFNVWLAEILGGYFLSRIWKRRAWHYTGRWAFFDGNITLAYAPFWLLLGLGHELMMFFFYEPVSMFAVSFLCADPLLPWISLW